MKEGDLAVAAFWRLAAENLNWNISEVLVLDFGFG